MTSAVVNFGQPVDKKAHLYAAFVTVSIATILLLLLWLIKIVTPIPPIPPDPEPITMEYTIIGESGGGYDIQPGGGSQGNTGEPGTQANSNDAATATPPNQGSVTSDDVNNPSAPNAGTASTQPKEPSVSNETKALLEKLKNKKSNTSIAIGGDGTGSPYSSGTGSGTGPGVGPGDGGNPGEGGGPGGPGGNGPGGGKKFRKILSKPEISNPTQEEATVVVNVYVDRSGIVKKAEVKTEGTTTANSLLRSTATQSAYKIRFDEDPKGPDLLILPIEINFTLK